MSFRSVQQILHNVPLGTRLTTFKAYLECVMSAEMRNIKWRKFSCVWLALLCSDWTRRISYMSWTQPQYPARKLKAAVLDGKRLVYMREDVCVCVCVRVQLHCCLFPCAWGLEDGPQPGVPGYSQKTAWFENNIQINQRLLVNKSKNITQGKRHFMFH